MAKTKANKREFAVLVVHGIKVQLYILCIRAEILSVVQCCQTVHFVVG